MSSDEERRRKEKVEAKVQAMLAADARNRELANEAAMEAAAAMRVDPEAELRRRRQERLRRHPWVPAGVLVTAGILAAGLMQFRAGNREASNRFMRYRIMAQGITLGLAMLSLAATPTVDPVTTPLVPMEAVQSTDAQEGVSSRY
eukprot:CAMPEP_0184683288 /NCGR_PEP_ID=MMETSP0312-20130426/10640_1 /TAXON_ID=31354 /ORGANISM="Compsopogon coeruleus, Strain SAG 36.94" /LENGTH=144 /DNA_ID=CAMNT_0027135503 /DNA_START=256 /DNA_END=690 /DNA_ORIENTATION=-